MMKEWKMSKTTIETTPTHWDCECNENHIKPKSLIKCSVCKANQDEQPDARIDEIKEEVCGFIEVNMDRPELREAIKKYGGKTNDEECIYDLTVKMLDLVLDKDLYITFFTDYEKRFI